VACRPETKATRLGALAMAWIVSPGVELASSGKPRRHAMTTHCTTRPGSFKGETVTTSPRRRTTGSRERARSGRSATRSSATARPC